MKCSVYADELAKLELKWKEQVKINEGIKLQLATMEDQYKVSYLFMTMNGYLFLTWLLISDCSSNEEL